MCIFITGRTTHVVLGRTEGAEPWYTSLRILDLTVFLSCEFYYGPSGLPGVLRCIISD